MRSAVRWTVAAVVLVAAFFGTWYLCIEFLHALGRDVVLSLAGLATAVVSLPAGAWAAREKGRTVGKRSLMSARSLGAPLGQVVVGEIPRRPAAFQVRDDLRAELAAVRGVAVVTAVTGSRGIGKTHLAAAYARECVTEGWPVIAWIVAESPGQALSGMERLARVLGVAGPRDDALTCARNARAWLESQADARCLVVFDNVLDVEAIRVWLPSAGRARIIVTSTNTACERLGTAVRVGVFTIEEAAAFLRERTGLDDAGGAHELAEEVGRLPLALGQAAAVLSAQHLSFRTVTQRLREMPLDRFLVRDLAEAYPHGVAQAVLLAMDAVERADPLAGALARLIAVLSPAGTSRDVLRGYHELDEQRGDATVANIDAAVGHLAEASLITFSVDDEAVLMHRLTQRVLRDAENHRSGLDEQVLIAGKLIRACLPEYQDRWARRALGRHLILHIDALWDLVAQDANRNGEVREAARKILSLRNWSVSYLWTIQDPERAIERGVPIAADHERLLGSDCRETVDAWYGLALAYGMQRRHDEAIALNQKVVDWYAAHDGVAAHSTSIMRNTFGNNFIESADDFRQPSRLSTAVAIHEQNFTLSEQHLGIDHRETRRSGLNLARAYLDIGRSAEARALAARMKELCMLAATPGDDVTLQSYEVLARTLAADGALGEALAEIGEGISVSIAMRGDDHPATWRVRKTRAEFLQQAGHIDVALGELEQVVAAYTRLLGSNSPATSKTLESLADAYVNAGRTAQAAAIYEKAMQACVQSVGDNSPITRRIAAKVAGLKAPSGRSSRRTRRRARATTGSGARTR